MTDKQKMREAFEKIIVDLDLNSPIHAAWACFQAGAAWQAAQTGTGYIQTHSELNLSQDESYPNINECRAALNELCETYYNYGAQAARDKTAGERTEHLARAIDCKTRVAQIIGHLRTPQQPQPVSDGVSGEGARTITTIVSKPCQYALKRLGSKAIAEKRGHISWAVVHPGHAGFPTLFETKKQADEYRRNHARAYIVCRVLTIPLYGEIYAK